MNVVTRNKNSAVAVLDLEGPLTIGAETRHLAMTLNELLQLGVPRIVLNMAGVSYLDCSGIGRLLEFRKQVASAGGCMKLVGIGPRFRALFDLFQLAPVLGVCESEGAAIASFFEHSQVIPFNTARRMSHTAHLQNGRQARRA